MIKDYSQTLEFLFSQLPMYQNIGKDAMKKNLDNISKLCKHLDNPQNKIKSIHIAGTNGKGSVTHIITSILMKAGFKVGCYTSPHYKDFRERIKINASFISENSVVHFVNDNLDIIDRVKPSFFEITVAMAFNYFAKSKVDFAVIETGLGGRLDSTNIIHPILSIITNIGMDHVQFLGDTIEKIAGEKAGIIKKNVPVIIGKRQGKTMAVFKEKSEETNSELFYAEEIVMVKNYQSGLSKRTEFDIIYKNDSKRVSTDLSGIFQEENLQTALASIYYLKENKILEIDDESTYNGLKDIQKSTYFIGRNMLISNEPIIIADSAHNIDGIGNLVREIKNVNYDKLHFVYGTVSDKDVASILTLLPKKAIFYFSKPNIMRGMAVSALEKIADKVSLEYSTFSSVKKAFESAKTNAKKDDLIIVSGSIFVVSEIL